MDAALKKGRRYLNPHLKRDPCTFVEFLRWKLGFYKNNELPIICPPNFSYPRAHTSFDPTKSSVLWVGHSTFLIKCGGLTLLTDPVFANYCSPIPLRRFKRHSAPPFQVSTLPKIDIALLSHNHYDHLDDRTVRALAAQQPHIRWILPKGLRPWFHKRNITRCVELGWGDTLPLNSCAITAVPAQHFSGRSLWDRNKTHWNGYVLEISDKKLYFAGDTGYNGCDFKQIGFRFAPIDLSLIPIGAYLPRKFLSPIHCSPREGVQIHQDVGSRFSLGMHWNTFRLGDESLDLPPYELYVAMKEKKLPFDTFIPINNGIWINW